MTTTQTDLEASTYQRRPAYRYLRATDRLPRIDEVIHLPQAEITCPVRLFNPTGRQTWWIAAYDPDTRLAYGITEVHGRGVGPIYMPELVAFAGRFGLPIERDLHYRPVTMDDVMLEGLA